MIPPKKIQPLEAASPVVESECGHEAGGFPSTSSYPLPVERLDFGDESPLRTFSPPRPYLAVKPEPPGARDELQPFDAGALLGRVDADEPQLGGGARSDGPEAPRPPMMRGPNHAQGRGRWKGWLIAVAVIALLFGLAEWLRPSDAELARRQISALQGELKVRQAERIEHAAQCQALAAVDGGELVKLCAEGLASRLRLDAEDASRINQQIKQLQALEGAARAP